MKKYLIIASLLAAGLLSVNHVSNTPANVIHQKQTPQVVEKQENNILYSEDFSGTTLHANFANFKLENGRAVWNGTERGRLDLPISAWSKDNNYEISFDLMYNGQTSTFFHFNELDGTEPGKNFFFELVAGGQFMKLSDFYGHDVYDNSGDDQGSMNQICLNKLKTEGVNFKFVILDNVMEVYTDGRRIIATPFTAFGNNRYGNGRRAAVKGILNGLWADIDVGQNNMWIDNIVVSKATRGNTHIVYEGEPLTQGMIFIPATIQNLYHKNFHFEADFEIHRALVENGAIHGYPKLKFMLNQKLGIAPSGKACENWINGQIYLDREFGTPWIGALNGTYDWQGTGGDYTQANFNGSTRFNLSVDVVGNDITFTTISNKANSDHKFTTIKTNFANLGITKGTLVALAIQNEYSNVLRYEYYGYDTITLTELVNIWSKDFMHMNDEAFNSNNANLCGKTYLPAKTALNNLEIRHPGAIKELRENTTFESVVARYEAWARANNDAEPFSGDTIVTNNVNYLINFDDSANIQIIIALAALILFSAFAFILIKKRKHA